MKPGIYTPIIKKAAQAYFREDDAPIALLNSRQHRRLIDAVHAVYAAMSSETERKIVEAVYKDAGKGFTRAVREAADACKMDARRAWAIVDRFTVAVENKFLS